MVAGEVDPAEPAVGEAADDLVLAGDERRRAPAWRGTRTAVPQAAAEALGAPRLAVAAAPDRLVAARRRSGGARRRSGRPSPPSPGRARAPAGCRRGRRRGGRGCHRRRAAGSAPTVAVAGRAGTAAPLTSVWLRPTASRRQTAVVAVAVVDRAGAVRCVGNVRRRSPPGAPTQRVLVATHEVRRHDEVGRRRVQRRRGPAGATPPASGPRGDRAGAALAVVGVEPAAQLVALVEQRLVRRQRRVRTSARASSRPASPRSRARRRRPATASVPADSATRVELGGEPSARVADSPPARRRRSGSSPVAADVPGVGDGGTRASSRSRRAASSWPGQSSRTAREASELARCGPASRASIASASLDDQPSGSAERRLGQRVERLVERRRGFGASATASVTAEPRGVAGAHGIASAHDALDGGDDGADVGEGCSAMSASSWSGVARSTRRDPSSSPRSASGAGDVGARRSTARAAAGGSRSGAPRPPARSRRSSSWWARNSAARDVAASAHRAAVSPVSVGGIEQLDRRVLLEGEQVRRSRATASRSRPVASRLARPCQSRYSAGGGSAGWMPRLVLEPLVQLRPTCRRRACPRARR